MIEDIIENRAKAIYELSNLRRKGWKELENRVKEQAYKIARQTLIWEKESQIKVLKLTQFYETERMIIKLKLELKQLNEQKI